MQQNKQLCVNNHPMGVWQLIFNISIILLYNFVIIITELIITNLFTSFQLLLMSIPSTWSVMSKHKNKWSMKKLLRTSLQVHLANTISRLIKCSFRPSWSNKCTSVLAYTVHVTLELGKTNEFNFYTLLLIKEDILNEDYFS